MESSQITLALHEHVFHSPLDVINVTSHASVPIVAHCVSEIVKCQIINLKLVALGHGQAELLRVRNVIVLAQVTRGHSFEAISAEMPIELH